MRQQSEDDEAIKIFLDWASDEVQVRKWQRELNLRKLLGPRPRNFEKAAKGRDSDAMLVQIKGVLPQRIADGAASIIARISDKKWNTLEGDGDPSKPSLDGIRAAHRFGAVVDPSGIHGGPELLKALSRLMPPADNRHASFHLGRFEEGDFLAQQNDAAYCAVDAGSRDPSKAGQILKCSRDVALMLFLSKDRKESGGGLLRDLYYQHRADHKGATYVPEFNSLIAFHVPRDYEITPVLSDDPLLSVFGWYLQEGELYDLKALTGWQPPTAEEMRMAESKKSLKEKAKAAKRKLKQLAKKQEQLSAVPDFLLALAKERQKARENKQFSRADAIREECAKHGYRFNAGDMLVKMKSLDQESSSADKGSQQPKAQGDAKAKASADDKIEKARKSDAQVDAPKLPARAAASAAAAAAAAAATAAPSKKKNESKAQRLQRQAKEAAAAAASGEDGKNEGGNSETSERPSERGASDRATSERGHMEMTEASESGAGKAGEVAAGKAGGDGPAGKVGKRHGLGEAVTEAHGGKKKKKKTESGMGDEQEEDLGGGEGVAGREGRVAPGEKRKRSGGATDAERDGGGVGETERVVDVDGQEAEDETATEGRKKTKRGGKHRSNAGKLLALTVRPAAPAAAARPGAAAHAETATEGSSGGKTEAKKAKKPKKPKGDGEGAAAQEQESGGKGRGRDMLLARIKNKGWLGVKSAAPEQQQ